MTDFDLVAIGGGTGGLAAVRAAAVAGKRAALITDAPIGGDCTWTGCVPSKTLISAAASGMDFPDAMARVRSTVEHIAGTEDAEVLEREGVTVIEGRGRLVGGMTVDVGGTRLTAGHIVVATGSRPAVPPIPGLAGVDVVTNENVWELDQLPERLGVVGGGAIGCELAQAFARLGSEVTQWEVKDRLLAVEEPEASQVIERVFTGTGIDVRTGASMNGVEGLPGGRALLDAGGDRPVEVDRILIAAGRVPNTSGLGLEAAGVRLTPSGHVAVDGRLRTTAAGIWAVGDVNGVLPFTHAANEQGVVVGRQAAGVRMNWRFQPDRVPVTTFCSPEVARVGVTEARAPRGARVAYLPMTENDRAITEGRTEGFIKLIAAPRGVLRHVAGGRIVGATVVADRAGEMIHEPAMAMLLRSFTARLAQLSHAYPTWSVGMQKAAAQFFQEIEGRSARPARRR